MNTWHQQEISILCVLKIAMSFNGVLFITSYGIDRSSHVEERAERLTWGCTIRGQLVVGVSRRRQFLLDYPVETTLN